MEEGSHETFVHEVKLEVDWDRDAYGFTFPMQKRTVSV